MSSTSPDLTDTSRAALRAEVGALRRHEHRRIFPSTLCLGELAGDRMATALPWPPRPEDDDGLLFDLLDALHDRWGAQEAAVWLARPGVPELHDLDLRVTAVAERVLAARGVSPTVPCTVVTRYGWLEPRGGEFRRWKRLRLPAQSQV